MSTPVCILGKYPFGETDGSVSYARLLSRAVAEAGFTPHLFCAGPRTETISTGFGVVHVVRAPGRAPWPPLDTQAPLLAPWLVPALVRFGIRRGGPLLIHGLSVWAWVGLLAARALERRGTRAVPVASVFDVTASVVASARANLWELPGPRARARRRLLDLWRRHGVPLFERRAYTGCRLALVNYEAIRHMLREAFGPGVPTRRVPYAPESAFLHEPRAPERPPPPAGLAGLADPSAPLVVAASKHTLHKGLDLLLRALALLRDRGLAFRACLVGPGVLLDSHRHQARRLGLDGRVAIPGEVPDSFPYLRHADVFVLPSRGEGGSGSLAVLEALQAGVAVVASRCHGIPEDVEDGREALLTEPGDQESLVEALARVLADPGLRQRLGAAGRATFERRFSARGLVEALGQVYGELGFRPDEEGAGRRGDSDHE